MILLLLAFIAMHIATELLPRTAAHIVSYVNIFLHALAVLPLGILKFTIEEAVLFYMISVFSLTLIRTVSFLVRGKRAQSKESGNSSDSDDSSISGNIGKSSDSISIDKSDGGNDSAGAGEDSCGEGSL